MFALPILEPESEAWFAQNLDDFLAAYDWTVPMAMPLMESVPAEESNARLTRLVKAVAARPGALNKTIFELQAGDWAQKPQRAVADERLVEWMRVLQLNGIKITVITPTTSSTTNLIFHVSDLNFLRTGILTMTDRIIASLFCVWYSGCR